MWLLVVGLALVVVVIYDVLQKRHAILRSFPIIGHFRYILEAIGPELRQYIVTDNNEERPFTRDQRRWVYASSKKENNYFGFGTDNDLETASNFVIIKHQVLSVTPSAMGEAYGKAGAEGNYPLPCAKVLGGARGRAHSFRPASAVNLSAMSFGSLSSAAVSAMNQGARIAGCLQNTGEGGISPYHRQGGDLIWQVGTGYFGCRSKTGGFDMNLFLDQIDMSPVRAVEIKLSQGAKPGLGGLLPGAKVTREVAGIRGVPVGEDVFSPAQHSAFGGVDEMLDFVEMLADATGHTHRHQIRGRGAPLLGGAGEPHVEEGSGGRLHFHRWGRGWDRSRPPRVFGSRGVALQGWIQPCVSNSRRGRNSRGRGPHGVG